MNTKDLKELKQIIEKEQTENKITSAENTLKEIARIYSLLLEYEQDYDNAIENFFISIAQFKTSHVPNSKKIKDEFKNLVLKIREYEENIKLLKESIKKLNESQ